MNPFMWRRQKGNWSRRFFLQKSAKEKKEKSLWKSGNETPERQDEAFTNHIGNEENCSFFVGASKWETHELKGHPLNNEQ